MLLNLSWCFFLTNSSNHLFILLNRYFFYDFKVNVRIKASRRLQLTCYQILYCYQSFSDHNWVVITEWACTQRHLWVLPNCSQVFPQAHTSILGQKSGRKQPNQMKISKMITWCWSTVPKERGSIIVWVVEEGTRGNAVGAAQSLDLPA